MMKAVFLANLAVRIHAAAYTRNAFCAKELSASVTFVTRAWRYFVVRLCGET